MFRFLSFLSLSLSLSLFLLLFPTLTFASDAIEYFSGYYDVAATL